MKVLFDLAKSVGDTAIAMKINAATLDLQSKLFEIQIGAQKLFDENRQLKDRLDALAKDRTVVLAGGVNWEKRSDDKYDGPLCPSCWGLLGKRVPMEKNERRNHPDYVVYECSHHDPGFDRRVTKTVLETYLK